MRCNKGRSLFQLKTSWISLVAPWFFNSSRAKMLPTLTVIPFPKDCHRGCAASSWSCEGCLTISFRWWHFFRCCQACWKQQDQQQEQLACGTGEAVPAQDPLCSPGKFILNIHLCWDFTLGAACKLNKYCNIFVRQLY